MCATGTASALQQELDALDLYLRFFFLASLAA
jgi:hypothetical protein